MYNSCLVTSCEFLAMKGNIGWREEEVFSNPWESEHVKCLCFPGRCYPTLLNVEESMFFI